MKTRIGLAILTTIAVSSASAATHIEFSGSFCITVANAACNADGWGVGSCLAARYVAQGLGDDGESTRLSVFDRTYAANYLSPSVSLIGTTFQPVTGTVVSDIGRQWSANARITAQSPASPTATTAFLNMTGDIQAWDDTVGCNISFKASFTHCPETFC